jgi:hypothetical protein
VYGESIGELNFVYNLSLYCKKTSIGNKEKGPKKVNNIKKDNPKKNNLVR